MKLPYNGTRKSAVHKKSDLLIVLTYHFGGTQNSVDFHVKLFNELGYDCLTFDLGSYDNLLRGKYLSRNGQFGIRHVWADQIEDILSLTDEPQIVFSQSVSGIPALNAIARRKCKNIHGFIGDGGPFLKFAKGMWNFYTYAYPTPLPIRPLAWFIGLIAFGVNIKSHTNNILKQLPKNFPILSLRAEKDRLITPTAIDQVFSKHNHIDVRTIYFKNSDHLKPLKDEPEKYKKALVQFLNKSTFSKSSE